MEAGKTNIFLFSETFLIGGLIPYIVESCNFVRILRIYQGLRERSSKMFCRRSATPSR